MAMVFPFSEKYSSSLDSNMKTLRDEKLFGVDSKAYPFIHIGRTITIKYTV